MTIQVSRFRELCKYAFVTLFLISTFFSARANMASPIQEGTSGIGTISSRDIEVLDEHIFVKLDSSFGRIEYSVQYHILTPESGMNIPFLFVALWSNFRSFEVLVDGQSVDHERVGNDWKLKNESSNSRFKFNDLWLFGEEENGHDSSANRNRKASIMHYYELDELNYFEVNLDSGEHVIEISYTGYPTEDRTNWAKEYEIEYALSPIAYWKDYGTICIDFESTEPFEQFESNYQAFRIEGNTASFEIDSVTDPNLKIRYKAELPKTAKSLINFGPENISRLLAFFLAILHVIFIRLYRKRSIKKYSWVVIVGSILIPFIYLISIPFVYEYIDQLIGLHASRHHGYLGLSIILYPILMPVYWLIMWLIDRYLKKKSQSSFRNN